LAVLGVSCAAPGFAQVADYPNRPVTLIVSYPPGGSSDFFTRLMATELSKLWGQTVVVENKPGAGGSLGAMTASQAAPDGYTLFMGSIATHAINQWLYSNLGYDPVKDFAPISEIATVPNVLVVNPSIPVNNVQELLTWARSDRKHAFYASPGAGTSPHLSSELLKSRAKIDLTHVPYKGDAPALMDVMAGQVPMAIVNLPSAMTLIHAGKVKALAVTSPTRSRDLPNVPTMQEAGVPDYSVTSWWAMFAPAGTPPALISKLNADVVKVLKSPTAIEAIHLKGASPAPSTPAELAAHVKSETARWGKVIRDNGISKN
jgi:tripartite-type tricarboxylate transporter receptor subunit TctC